MREPCKYIRCIHYNNQGKCKKCGRAYANKESLKDVIRVKLTRPTVDLFITTEDLWRYRKFAITGTIFIGALVSVSAAIIYALIGGFR